MLAIRAKHKRSGGGESAIERREGLEASGDSLLGLPGETSRRMKSEHRAEQDVIPAMHALCAVISTASRAEWSRKRFTAACLPQYCSGMMPSEERIGERQLDSLGTGLHVVDAGYAVLWCTVRGGAALDEVRC